MIIFLAFQLTVHRFYSLITTVSKINIFVVCLLMTKIGILLELSFLKRSKWRRRYLYTFFYLAGV